LEKIREDNEQIVVDMGYMLYDPDSFLKKRCYLIKCKLCGHVKMVSKENFEEQEIANSEE